MPGSRLHKSYRRMMTRVQCVHRLGLRLMSLRGLERLMSPSLRNDRVLSPITVDSSYNVPLGKQEKVRNNEMFIIKRCFYYVKNPNLSRKGFIITGVHSF